MIVCRAEGLSRHYTADPLFVDLGFQIDSGERIGLVGVNGAGKTTLVKLLARLEQPDGGRLDFHPDARVAYLRQFHDFNPERSLIAELRSAMAHLESAYADMVDAGRRMAEAADPVAQAREAKRYDDLQEMLRRHGGYDFEHRLEEVLEGLGFNLADADRPMRSFSGGQQSRVMLGKLLLGSPDLLLLDEPTNHLDIRTTEWLEDYLVRQESAMIVVSHDRYFLDKVINRVWELHRGKLTPFTGGYTQYQRLREERQKAAERVREKQDAAIAHNEDFIRRNAYGQLAKQAKSREKMVERLRDDLVETIDDIRGPRMGFGAVTRTGDIVFSASELGKAFGDHVLFRKGAFDIQRGERVGIIGPNGAGKTTLLKILLGQEPPTEGAARMGHGVKLGYLDQNLDMLDRSQTPLEAVRPPWRQAEKEEPFRALLARFGIFEDRADATIGTLSGGERARVALARIAALEINVLILDEPTNHLDLWAREALEEALAGFEGTILAVSHDRWFLDRAVGRLLAVEDGGIRSIPGNWTRYDADRRAKLKEEAERRELEREKRERRETRAAEARRAEAEANGDIPLSPAPDAAPKRKRKFPFRKVRDLELDIEKAEARIADHEARLVDPEVYKDGRKVAELTRAMETDRAELTRLMEHWEEAMELNPAE
jgi:ATP-binding cassette subfamily F protein 3